MHPFVISFISSKQSPCSSLIPTDITPILIKLTFPHRDPSHPLYFHVTMSVSLIFVHTHHLSSILRRTSASSSSVEYSLRSGSSSEAKSKEEMTKAGRMPYELEQ